MSSQDDVPGFSSTTIVVFKKYFSISLEYALE
jgi:hypothetical protein